MEQFAHIVDHVRIEGHKLYRNGEIIFATEAEDFADFAKQSYKTLGMQYPKFYKMDNLSKLAILGSELLLQAEYDHQNVAILLSNKSGSLDTDRRHQETIQEASNYYPSPAIFVYTLPNICMGEISIRHDLKSENVFIISDEFDAETIHTQTSFLLSTNRADAVLCGWVELIDEYYKAVLYLVGTNGKHQHTINQIKDLIK